MDALAQASGQAKPAALARVSRDHAEAFAALAAFAVLCLLVLIVPARLVEPDDYAYRASIVAITQGHFLTLSTAQVDRLAAQLPGPVAGVPGVLQWVQLPDGRWISEKDPGYPFLAAPFQALGIIRLAPLFYGALGCLGLFFGARRWLGRYGGAAAVVLFCSSGAALLFAWRDYMPTFTDASLIAAGTGGLLWAVLAAEATARRRTWTGLAGFAALEVAVFVRYTDIVVLGCAVVAVVAAWRLRAVPAAALGWWLGSVAVFGAAVAVFDDLVYGGPLRSGYQPGEITFSLAAVLPNLRYMPAHLIQAMPMLVLGLTALAWIAARWVRLRGNDDERAARARRDLAVALALAASWFSVWGLYAAYTWTANPFGSTLQFARFYVPAIGAISLLGSWLVTRLPRRAWLAAVTSGAVAVAMFGLGAWSFAVIHQFSLGGIRTGPPPAVQPAVQGRQPPAVRPAVQGTPPGRARRGPVDAPVPTPPDYPYAGHVSSGVTAAVIAATVSVVVAVGSVTVTFLTTRASLRRDHERQQAEFRRTMTERLYDRRVAVYPELWRATDAFRNSRLNSAQDLRDHLAKALAQVDVWHAQEGGLLLSARAYEQLLELRMAVRQYISDAADSDQLEQLKRDIWSRKNSLRRAMRADLGLLFDED